MNPLLRAATLPLTLTLLVADFGGFLSHPVALAAEAANAEDAPTAKQLADPAYWADRAERHQLRFSKFGDGVEDLMQAKFDITSGVVQVRARIGDAEGTNKSMAWLKTIAGASDDEYLNDEMYTARAKANAYLGKADLALVEAKKIADPVAAAWAQIEMIDAWLESGRADDLARAKAATIAITKLVEKHKPAEGVPHGEAAVQTHDIHWSAAATVPILAYGGELDAAKRLLALLKTPDALSDAHACLAGYYLEHNQRGPAEKHLAEAERALVAADLLAKRLEKALDESPEDTPWVDADTARLAIAHVYGLMNKPKLAADILKPIEDPMPKVTGLTSIAWGQFTMGHTEPGLQTMAKARTAFKTIDMELDRFWTVSELTGPLAYAGKLKDAATLVETIESEAERAMACVGIATGILQRRIDEARRKAAKAKP